MSKEKHLSKEEKYLELGRKLQEFYDAGYVSRKQTLLFSFVKGLMGGAGAFIGGTLVIAILLWLLSLLDQVPFVETAIRNVQENLKK